jgi:uncharacterized membrane protein
MFRAKNVAFAVVAIMTGYVLYHDERFLVEPANPIWQHYESFKWWLLPHGLAGASAILLAPMQFSDRLRRRFTRLHRVVGRVYVVGVFVLAPLGVVIESIDQRLGDPPSFLALSVVNAVILIVPTAIAFFFAMKRRISQHRQWMTRSYAVALVFFESRFILGITGWDALGIGIVETVTWVCLAVAILIADLANQWQEVRAARPGLEARAQPSAAGPA